MKRLYLFITLISLIVLETAAENIKGIITLSHNGNDSFFAYDKLGDAIKAAVDGDTISFSRGEYQGDFVLDKAITLIGTSPEYTDYLYSKGPTLSGQLTVKIPNSDKNTNLSFDGINFGGEIALCNTLGEVTFRRCSWHIFSIYNSTVETLLLDRCNGHFDLNQAGATINKNIIAKNCKFNILNSNRTNAIYYNCNIMTYQGFQEMIGQNTEYFSKITGTFYNCIIKNAKGYLQEPNDTTENKKAKFINCLYDNYNTNIDVTRNCTVEACYANPSADTNIYYLKKEELESNKYFGTDGTVVGCYGGENPYTQINSDIPTCSIAHKVHINNEQDQIEVNLNTK